jgi:hypothetical protein
MAGLAAVLRGDIIARSGNWNYLGIQANWFLLHRRTHLTTRKREEMMRNLRMMEKRRKKKRRRRRRW